MNEFHPIYRIPIESYTTRLRSLLDRQAILDAEIAELNRQWLKKDFPPTNKKEKRKEKRKRIGELVRTIAACNKKRKETKAEIERLQAELTARLAAPSVPPFADETPQTINECIGYCYGVCVYVGDRGDLLYRETDPEGAEHIGESYADTSELRPFAELDPNMAPLVHNYLHNSYKTPFWAKETYFEKEITYEEQP